MYSLSNLADMLTMVNPSDFGGHSSKVKVTMGIIDKCGVRGDATLCVVIFLRVARLSSKLLRQGNVMERLKSSLRKFYGRYGDLIKHYEVSLS